MYACMYDSESVSSVQFASLGNTSQNQISGKTSRNTVLLRLVAAAWPPLCQVKVNSPGEKKTGNRDSIPPDFDQEKKTQNPVHIYV